MWKSEDKENAASIAVELGSNQYRQEEINSKSKFNSLVKGIHSQNEFYNLESLVNESYEYTLWNEQEWGFPKGRRNYQENEYECAIREFTEETGYSGKFLKMVVNIYPFEEVFMGSNYKTYKHKYFLTFMDYAESLKHVFISNTEVSSIEWLSYEECMYKIRPYNEEKKEMITKVNNCIHNYMF
jgi:8-oxo-dGTP pyrophosphatase MutT (NUDIX family)